MKFFPISSANHVVVVSDGPFDMPPGIIRIVSDSFASIFVGNNSGTTGAFAVRENKAYFYRNRGGSNTQYTIVTGPLNLANVNVSFSPYLGGDFDELPVNNCLVSASAGGSSQVAVRAIGKMNIVRELNGEQVFFKFDGTANDQSIMLIGDETFTIPENNYVTGYASADTQFRVAGIT